MNHSELRKDLVSRDWILIAPGRTKRPEEFLEKRKRAKTSKSKCPFENPESAGNEKPIAVYAETNIPQAAQSKKWRVQIVPNKYPAVTRDGTKAKLIRKGPYTVMNGVGYHELLITRDHDANFPRLKKADGALVFRAFRDRYSTLLDDKEVAYISMFHNWGSKAGASIYHPHYQMIALPVVPPDVNHSLVGSRDYFSKNKKCVHCLQITAEIENKKRVIFENDHVVAFMPFVSRAEFEIRILPKDHLPFFEDTQSDIMDLVAETLQSVLKLLEKSLKDPDYNFFIHTAPVKNKSLYQHYHWHIEIQPKINLSAGFELGTGIEINVVDPDDAAKIIKGYV